MITIGLTGGIASGKSTVSAELRSLGLPVLMRMPKHAWQ